MNLHVFIWYMNCYHFLNVMHFQPTAAELNIVVFPLFAIVPNEVVFPLFVNRSNVYMCYVVPTV